MSMTEISAAAQTFDSRLATLSHLLKVGFESKSEPNATFLGHRLVPDMLSLGTQVAFTCNQPRNFALWLSAAEADDLDPNAESLGAAERYIADTRALLLGYLSSEGSLPAKKHLVLGAEFYAELTGREYLEDFLLPNANTIPRQTRRDRAGYGSRPMPISSAKPTIAHRHHRASDKRRPPWLPRGWVLARTAKAVPAPNHRRIQPDRCCGRD